MNLKKINWTSNKKDDIESIHGKIDGVLLFTITKFKSDPYIFESNVIPMMMRSNEKIDLVDLDLLASFDNSFSSDLDVDKLNLDKLKHDAQQVLESFIKKMQYEEV